MPVDLSYGSVILFNNEINGIWNHQTQKALAFGQNKCSRNEGIEIKGISSETLYLSNNSDIKSSLNVNYTTVNEYFKSSLNLEIGGDISGLMLFTHLSDISNSLNTLSSLISSQNSVYSSDINDISHS